MTAYYNEHDKDKAEWLRELIRQNIVAPGEVDERDIKQVTAKDLQGFKQCHFFAGIGVWSYSLRLAGWPDDRPVWTGSCPCPSFSAAGQGRGFDDPRHLWPDWSRLIGECRPATIFGEQVDDAIGHGWLDLVQTDLERQAYAVGKAVLGACSVGAPHIRQRLYFVADSEHAERWPVNVYREHGCDGQDSGRAEAHGEPRACGEVRSMADTDGGDSSAERQQRSGEYGQFAQDGGIGERLGDASQCRGRPFDGKSRSGNGQKITARGSGVPYELGDSARRGRGMCGSASGNTGRTAQSEPTGDVGDSERYRRKQGTAMFCEGQPVFAGAGEVGSVGDSNGERRQQISGSASGDEGTDGRWPEGNHVAAGASESFWSDADWIWCRDGKYRPVEPGTFPLVTGAPFRVLRLRGYGDAINAEVAKAFIQAYLES